MLNSCTHDPYNYHDMVKIQQVDPSIQTDLRYKTSNNITKQPLYPADMPTLLRPNTAKRLAHANQLVTESGYRLKIWDAYRPQSAQIALWDSSGQDSNFVANPYENPSLHTHGVAVDVTLAFPDGSPAPMPTDFDDFSNKASPHYIHPSPVVRRNLRILKDAMHTAGFLYIHSEWWHFLDKDYKQYSIIPSIQ
ncbi:MAG: M15 family metallopeptidase [Akkermansiaceae bacterium]